jgi:hypothetical protein
MTHTTFAALEVRSGLGTTSQERCSPVMRRFFFHIGDKYPFRDALGTELLDEVAAWRHAVLLTRDIETYLRPGDAWSLDVTEGDNPLYRIRITTEEF